jgi:trimeric autotransporter adhesin
MIMRRFNSTGLILLFLCAKLAGAYAQGSAFTYQGGLTDNASAANGTYEFRFALFDTVSDGTQIGPALTNSAVAVSSGNFTVTLDFGAGAFSGANRWLQIGVRTNGNGGAFTTLNPRQPITATPYATFAANAATAVSASSITNGTAVTSLNNLRDNVTLAAGSNVTITPSGNTLTINVPSSGSSNWFGSGGNTYITSGNIGIGTTTPQGLLDLHTGTSDTSALFVRGDPGSFGRGGVIHHQSSSYGWQELAQNTGSATDGYLAFSYVNRVAPGTKVAADILTIRGNGCVGIGTIIPERRLTVYGSGYGFEHRDGSVRLGSFIGAAGGYLGTVSNHKLHFFVNDGGGSMTIDTAQNVGIGTTTPSAKLDVRGTVTIEAGGDATLYTGTSGSEQNRYLSLINSPAFSSASGLKAGGVLVADSYGYSNPTKNQMIVKGNVAVGTPVPTSSIRVHGVASIGGTGVKGESPDWIGISGSGVYGAAGTTISSTGYGVFGRSYTGAGDSSYAGYFEGNLRTTEGLSVRTDGAFGGRVNAQEFFQTSDRNAKTNFAKVDPRSILDRLISVPIQMWNFTNQSESIRHIGPTAQDFHAAFNVGPDDKHISTIDADGVALAAIQGLNQKLEEEMERNRAKDAEILDLKKRLSDLEKLLRDSINTKE